MYVSLCLEWNFEKTVSFSGLRNVKESNSHCTVHKHVTVQTVSEEDCNPTVALLSPRYQSLCQMAQLTTDRNWPSAFCMLCTKISPSQNISST